MQSDVTSSADGKSGEQALDATQKRKGKERNQVAVESTLDTSVSNLISADTAQAVPPSEIPDSVSASHLPHPLHYSSETSHTQHRVRSRPTSRDTSPYPRSRPSTPNHSSSPNASKPVAPRRSQRTLGRGPERPAGPPELEAALAIAIRNLESDVYAWWCANQKPGNPIPTTAYLKGRSPRIRKAAEAVDEADRLLNEAVYGKPKKARTLKKSQAPSQLSHDRSRDITPETAFEELELDSQGSSSLRTAVETRHISAKTNSSKNHLPSEKE